MYNKITGARFYEGVTAARLPHRLTTGARLHTRSGRRKGGIMSLFDLRYISELVRAGFTRDEIMEMARLPKAEPEAPEKAEKPAPEPSKAATPEVSREEAPAPAINKEETTPHTRTEGTAPATNNQWLETLAKNS